MALAAESAAIAYGGDQLQPLESQHEQPLKDNSASPLNKQNSSIFSLTLDEIQLKSGKSFGSMNMDEFLTNLWNVEDNNQVSSQQPNQTEANNNHDKINLENQPTLARQNSFSIPIQICKKTVEEVWSEIQKEEPVHVKINKLNDHEPPARQQTFGEMTLEEFLIKAGVVNEAAAAATGRTPLQVNNANACLGMGQMMALGFSGHQNLLVNSYATYPIYTPTKSMVGELSSNSGENEKSHSMVIESGVLKNNKKRIIDGPPEVVVERRQRRMIKNRESAARSRARKQAYTVELELELNQLKEENEKLKQVVKEFEEKRLQEILKRIKRSTMARKKAEKLRKMKRTASSAW